MGVDVTQTVRVGYAVSEEELIGVYGRVTPEKSHFEDRFDPKTGQKIKSVKVIDTHEHVTLEMGGESYGDAYELAEDLGKILGADVFGYSDFGAECKFVFSLGHGTQPCDAKRCPENSEIDLETVMNDLTKLRELGSKLVNLGLGSGKLKILNCFSVG